jgi:hypothetical protein
LARFCPPTVSSGCLKLWLGFVILAGSGICVFAQSPTFAGNAQHTGIFDVPAQHLDRICWSTSINLHNTGGYTHYGAPLITASNTVLVPIKTTNGFRVSAFEGASGRLKYTLSTDYLAPPADWGPVYQPVIAEETSGPRLYYPGAGGTLFYVDNLDSDTSSPPVQLCFYTDLTTYQSNAVAFKKEVFINTPLTADTNGTVFFGFRVLTNTLPPPPGLTNGGFGRVDQAGNAIFVLAGTAAGDTRVGRVAQNSAPALSNDGSTLYVAVKGTNMDYYAYLLGLDTTTLALKYNVRLVSSALGQTSILDDSTASPVVGPDGDVFYGVYGNSGRGYMLHFSPDLKTQMPPSTFGWDNTPALVPTNMVPGYPGTSAYLLFTKYNNYVANGGDGINRMALLDPHATQVDPHHSFLEMREVLTVIGCTPDYEYQGALHPYAVREWCINTAAVNPITQSIFAPSEDGHIYRWNLAINALTEVAKLGPGLGEPYVPTVVGPDGMIYALNGGTLFALASATNVALSLVSSAPDLVSVLAGEPITFTAVVTNLDASGPSPTGTITFWDNTYTNLKPVTNLLGAAVALSNGLAAVTTSSLAATSNYLGNHYITASYSGDSNFYPASVTLIQKVHAHATITSVISSARTFGGPVTLAAVVRSSQGSGGTPSGMVSFWDSSNFLAQVSLNTNGIASFTTTNLTTTNLTDNGQSVLAIYSSDTMFGSSTGHLAPFPPRLTAPRVASNGIVQLSFSNIIGASFSVLSTPDISWASSNWTMLGPAQETLPGQFQFTDLQATNEPQQFYRLRSP